MRAVAAGRVEPRRTAPRLETLAAWLASAALVSILAVSSMMLARLGWAYETPGGLPFEKVHPGTGLALLALLILAAARGVSLVDDTLARAPGLLAYGFGWAVFLAYIVLILSVPFTGVIDTFLLPAVLLVLLVVGGVGRRRHVPLALHVLLTLNAILGLVEFATGWRLTPYVAGGVAIAGDWRSTALLGHPLVNSCVVAVYIVVLTTGGHRGLPPACRTPAFLLQVMALFVFGGRAALVVALAVVAVRAGIGVLGVIGGRRIGIMRVALAVLALPVAALAVLALVEIGFFDRTLERFVEDQGSAQTRLAMFGLFDELTWSDILLGPDPELIAALQRREGLEFGIESFWVAAILTYGLAASLVLFASLAFLCREIVRAAGGVALVPLACFFAIASTFVSLAGKSCLLAIITVMLSVLYRDPVGSPGRR